MEITDCKFEENVSFDGNCRLVDGHTLVADSNAWSKLGSNQAVMWWVFRCEELEKDASAAVHQTKKRKTAHIETSKDKTKTSNSKGGKK